MSHLRNQASSSLRSKQLGEILVEQGTVTLDQLNQALDLQESCDALLGALLIRLKFCNPEAVAMALHKQIKITDVKLNRIKVDGAAAALFDRAFCEENKLLPFELIGDLVCVTMANPLNRTPIVNVQKQLRGQTIKVFRTPWPDIQKTIDPVYAAVAAVKAAAKPRSRAPTGPGTTAVAQPGLGGQPGFERPLTKARAPSGAQANAPIVGTDPASGRSLSPASAAAPDLPEVPTAAPAASAPMTPVAAPPAIAIDGSWVDTRQNPHVVFHQRMLNTLATVGSPPACLRGDLNPALRRDMLVTLGLLIGEHSALLPQSIDFTLGPDQLKLLEWRALVLRGMFCYHLSCPYVLGAVPKAFTLHTPQDLAECFHKVREHFKLFQRELGLVNSQPEKLVHCNRDEIDHTLAHLERILMLLPPEAPAADGAPAGDAPAAAQ